MCCQRIALAVVETDRLDSRMRGLRQTCAVYSECMAVYDADLHCQSSLLSAKRARSLRG